jgi:tetratricopeptide (TPR) repeat protein
MKRLLVCLLLVGVVGCGESEQTQKQPDGDATPNQQQPSAEQPSGGTDAEAYYNQGLSYGELGEYDKAIADFTEVIRIYPDYAEPYVDRGSTYLKLKEYDKAIADYSKALEAPGEPLGIPLMHGDHLGFPEVYETAGVLAFAIEGEVYYNRATSYKELDDQVKAAADFAKAKELGYKP